MTLIFQEPFGIISVQGCSKGCHREIVQYIQARHGKARHGQHRIGDQFPARATLPSWRCKVCDIAAYDFMAIRGLLIIKVDSGYDR